MKSVFLKLLSWLLCPNNYHRVKNDAGELNRKFYHRDGILRNGVLCVHCEEVVAEIPDVSAAGSRDNLSWIASKGSFDTAVVEDRRVMSATSVRKQRMINNVKKACRFGYVRKSAIVES